MCRNVAPIKYVYKIELSAVEADTFYTLIN